MNNTELGKKGETVAVEYLKKKGYNILYLNFRYRRLEIDIVAEIHNVLVIIEVKTKSSQNIAPPESKVDNKKILNIVNATDKYINKFNVDMPVRFDIITIVGKIPNIKIEHIENAFRAPLTSY
ncbi:MAG: YraN family protein [Tannerella sp.]|jgi:putative endonuclease|nr:YraN family protein [Tannerella sp.]